MKRREFLARSGSTIIGSSLWFKCNNYVTSKVPPAKLYFHKSLDILRKIQNQELPKVSYIAIRAAEIYKGNGKVYSRIHWGNFIDEDLWFSARGNPGYLTQISRSDAQTFVEELQKGDFYITNEISPAVRDAKQRGAYVVGISIPAFPDKFTLPDQIISQPNWMTVEEASNIVLYSHVAIEDGILAFPEYPMVPLCPASSLPQIIYYWMLSAEMAYHLQSEKIHTFISKARDYIESIIMRLYDYEKQLDLIREAAQKMVTNIKAGGSFYVYDRTKSLIAEGCNRASGLMLTKPLAIDNIQPHDNVIIASELVDDADDIALVRQLREKKANIITISPKAEIEQKNTVYLSNEGHFALDNLAGEVRGVVRIKKEDPPICPASKVSNIILFWALTAQFIDEMIHQGLVPYVIMGEYLTGGAEYNAAIRPFFEKRRF